MQDLRQGTEIKVRIGPFVDVGDGFTPETGITLGAADEAELLKHNGAATIDISGATWAAVSGCDGWYDLTLTTSHTDTLGQMTVVVQDDSVCLPVFCRFMVLPTNVWDSVYGTDNLQVDLIQIGGAAQSATDLKDFADAGYDSATHTVAGLHSDYDAAKTAAQAGDEMDLVDAPNLAALTAIGTKLEAMILDEGDATALLAAIAAKVEEFLVNEGDATATIAAIATACNSAIVAGTVGTNVAAILENTGTTIPAEIAKVKGAVAGRKITNAAGTQVEIYDANDELLATLDLTGDGPYTWDVTWA